MGYTMNGGGTARGGSGSGSTGGNSCSGCNVTINPDIDIISEDKSIEIEETEKDGKKVFNLSVENAPISITSEDSSVTIEKTVDGFDLSVPKTEASVGGMTLAGLHSHYFWSKHYEGKTEGYYLPLMKATSVNLGKTSILFEITDRERADLRQYYAKYYMVGRSGDFRLMCIDSTNDNAEDVFRWEDIIAVRTDDGTSSSHAEVTIYKRIRHTLSEEYFIINVLAEDDKGYSRQTYYSTNREPNTPGGVDLTGKTLIYAYKGRDTDPHEIDLSKLTKTAGEANFVKILSIPNVVDYPNTGGTSSKKGPFDLNFSVSFCNKKYGGIRYAYDVFVAVNYPLSVRAWAIPMQKEPSDYVGEGLPQLSVDYSPYRGISIFLKIEDAANGVVKTVEKCLSNNKYKIYWGTTSPLRYNEFGAAAVLYSEENPIGLAIKAHTALVASTTNGQYLKTENGAIVWADAPSGGGAVGGGAVPLHSHTLDMRGIADDSGSEIPKIFVLNNIDSTEIQRISFDVFVSRAGYEGQRAYCKGEFILKDGMPTLICTERHGFGDDVPLGYLYDEESNKLVVWVNHWYYNKRMHINVYEENLKPGTDVKYIVSSETTKANEIYYYDLPNFGVNIKNGEIADSAFCLRPGWEDGQILRTVRGSFDGSMRIEWSREMMSGFEAFNIFDAQGAAKLAGKDATNAAMLVRCNPLADSIISTLSMSLVSIGGSVRLALYDDQLHLMAQTSEHRNTDGFVTLPLETPQRVECNRSYFIGVVINGNGIIFQGRYITLNSGLSGARTTLYYTVNGLSGTTFPEDFPRDALTSGDVTVPYLAANAG